MLGAGRSGRQGRKTEAKRPETLGKPENSGKAGDSERARGVRPGQRLVGGQGSVLGLPTGVRGIGRIASA